MLASTQPAFNDKENLRVGAVTYRGKHNSNARRRRFRLRHTGLSRVTPKPVCRQSRQSTSRTARTILLATEGDDPTDIPVLNTGPAAAIGQRTISLPRYLQRPAYRDIKPALSALDSNLNEVPIEYVHQKLQAVGEAYVALYLPSWSRPLIMPL